VRPQKQAAEASPAPPVWLKNWPLLTGAFSIGFIAVRLLGAAGGDPETAYAILQIQGTGNVVVGSLISGIGLVVAPLAIVSLVAYKADRDPEKTSLGWLAGVFGAIIVAATAPFGIFVVLVVLTAICSLMLRFSFAALAWLAARGKREPRQAHLSAYAVGGIYLSITLLFFCFSVFPPWLPAENIVIGPSTLTVYVLSQDSTTTYLLMENPVQIIRLNTGDIAKQYYCKTPGYIIGDEPLIQLLHLSGFWKPGKAPIYPRCLDIDVGS
jgi:hypothetical protein